MRFGKALREILRFELLWKVLFFCLLNPLFSGAYRTYVSLAGLSFNGSIVWTFLTLKGGALFLLLFFGAAWLVFYEYSVVVRIAALCRQGKSFTLGGVMRASLWDLGLLRGWSLVLGSLYYVLLLPMVREIYVSTMVPRVTIPWFVFGEMQKSTLGVVGMVAIYAAYLLVDLLLIFVPLEMVFGHRRFLQAVGGSLRCWRRIGCKGSLCVLGAFLIWNRVFMEMARYWRRNLLGSDDFNGDFIKYLVYSEAFRKDLLYWLLLALLETAAMAGAVYFLLFLLSKTGDVRVSLEPAWSRDGAVAWELLTRRWAVCRMRWRERMRTRCWRVGAWVLALTLVLSMLLSLENPLPVHEPLAIAHRGGIGGVENTLEAILSAADCGADYAEIDVQLSQDGVPVLFHDGNLRRMAGVGKSIGELTWEELQQLPIADNRHPGEITGLASLEEVLRALSNRPDMGLLIELKPAAGSGAALAGAVIDLVERYGFGGRAMFMSLDYLCLLPIMERHPEWWVGCCAYGVAGSIDDAVWRYQADFLAVEEALVSNQLVIRARELNLPVYVWSVYDSEKMRQYLEMGVSGLITDYPEDAIKVLAAYQDSHPGTEYIWQGSGLPRKEELG